MAGWYELTMNKDGHFRFALKSDADKTLLSSEVYKSRASAENGITSVQANCGKDERYELLTSANGRYYFNLKAGNHQVIGTSPMYGSEEARAAVLADAKACGTTSTVKASA